MCHFLSIRLTTDPFVKKKWNFFFCSCFLGVSNKFQTRECMWTYSPTSTERQLLWCFYCVNPKAGVQLWCQGKMWFSPHPLFQRVYWCFRKISIANSGIDMDMKGRENFIVSREINQSSPSPTNGLPVTKRHYVTTPEHWVPCPGFCWTLPGMETLPSPMFYHPSCEETLPDVQPEFPGTALDCVPLSFWWLPGTRALFPPGWALLLEL